MLFDEEFFPTPKNIIRKMIEPYRAKIDSMIILEPSAGRGDILDYIRNNYGYNSKIKMYCCEKDKNLQYILSEKGYPIISEDFLEYQDDHYFDLIIMNPPFSNSVDHLLKAWDILREGDICCLLNAETIRNPHSSKRQLLNIIVAEHGNVEFLGDCFQNAERQTKVEVALVRLSKKSESEKLNYNFGKVNSERDAFNLDENTFRNEVAIRDVIGNMMVQYENLKENYVQFLKVRDGLKFYSQGLLIQFTDIMKIINTVDETIDREYSRKDHEEQKKKNRALYNEFCDSVKLQIWSVVLNKLGIDRYMTNDVRQNFHKFIQTQGAMDFTKENVQNVIKMIFANSQNILDKAVVDVFDIFTKYHKENRVYVEGWKTNDKWKVNKKVILPNFVEMGYGGKYKTNYRRWNEYSDIDRVMAYLSGKKYEEILSLKSAIEQVRIGDSSLNESEFFFFRCYKKGTLHITFKDDSLWQEFNMRACAEKKWLPEAEEKAWKENKATPYEYKMVG